MITEVTDDEITARIEEKEGNSIEDGIQLAYFSPDDITKETGDQEPFRVADMLEWILTPEQKANSCDSMNSIDGVPVQLFVTKSLRRISKAAQITAADLQQALERAQEARNRESSKGLSDYNE